MIQGKIVTSSLAISGGASVNLAAPMRTDFPNLNSPEGTNSNSVCILHIHTVGHLGLNLGCRLPNSWNASALQCQPLKT